MKTRILVFSVASALCFALACGDDDDANGSGNTGGVGTSGGEAGNAAETGGTTHTGGVNAGGAGDAGGAGGAPITCEPPEPPSVSSDAGGAGGAGGGAPSGGAGGAVASGLAIEGSYVDNWDGHHTVTSSTWSSGDTVWHIAAFDNAAHVIIAQNDQGNMYSPCLWSRFDWTEVGGVLYYCQTAYGAESQAAALATPASDASDPATTGCGGTFPWTSLTAE
jgi:hypothetical protein